MATTPKMVSGRVVKTGIFNSFSSTEKLIIVPFDKPIQLVCKLLMLLGQSKPFKSASNCGAC
jgi:hypothetical protein